MIRRRGKKIALKNVALLLALSMTAGNVSYAASIAGSEEIVIEASVEPSKKSNMTEGFEDPVINEESFNDDSLADEVDEQDQINASDVEEAKIDEKTENSEVETENAELVAETETEETAEQEETLAESEISQEESETSQDTFESQEVSIDEETESAQDIIEAETGIEHESSYVDESKVISDEVTEEQLESTSGLSEAEAETETEPETEAEQQIETEGTSISGIYINPVYEDLVDESLLETTDDSDMLPRLGGDIDRLGLTYSRLNDAAEYIRRRMKQKYLTVSLTLDEVPYGSNDVNQETYDAFYLSLMELVYEESDDAREGDYLRYSILGASSNLSSITMNGSLISGTLTISNIKYTADYDQESELTSAVRQAVRSLNLNGKTDYEVTILINQYVIDRVTYDYEHLEDKTYTAKHSAYAAMIHGTAVCQGYAMLLYRMLRYAGVDCRIVSGIGNGGNHAWNIVKMDGSWYYVDPTWNDSDGYPNLWFLKGSSTFPNHSLEERFDSAFLRLHPISKTDYAVVTDAMDKTIKQNGWFLESGGWRYYRDGNYLSNQWVPMADEEDRYLDENGYMAVSRIVIYNGNGYCVDENGIRMQGWVIVGDNLYYADHDNRTLYYDCILTVSGERYVLDNLGRVLHGYVKQGQDGYYTINDMEDAILNADFFCGSCEDPSADEYGCMYTGWMEYTEQLHMEVYNRFKHIRFYFDPETGKKVSLKTVTINGTSYAFDIGGVLVEGIAAGYTNAEAAVSDADIIVTWDQAENAGLYYIYRLYTNMGTNRTSTVTKCAEVDGELTSWTDPGVTGSKGDYTYIVLTEEQNVVADDFGRIEASNTVQIRFTDVPTTGVYYSTPVYWAADNGITAGYSDGSFGVGRDCQRRELMIFLWRYAGQPTGYGDARKMFNDMGSYGASSATNQAIAWAYKTGITKGYSDGGFHPTAPIVRKDVMILLYRLAGKPAVSGTLSFPDCKNYNKSSDTYKAILWGSKNGITNGYSSGQYKGQFGVGLNCLREQIVTFLYRYDNKYGK